MSRATIRERAQIKYHALRPRYEDNVCVDCDYFVDKFKFHGFTHKNFCRKKIKSPLIMLHVETLLTGRPVERGKNKILGRALHELAETEALTTTKNRRSKTIPQFQKPI